MNYFLLTLVIVSLICLLYNDCEPKSIIVKFHILFIAGIYDSAVICCMRKHLNLFTELTDNEIIKKVL